MRKAAAVALIFGLVLSSCRDRQPDPIPLDGTPRRPDAVGVVADVTRSRLRLAGGASYDVSPRVQAFTTATLEVVPLLARRGHFVHLGLDGDEVVWLAAFSAVVEQPGAEPAVYYAGRIERVASGEVVFTDGTVLPRGDVALPPVGHRARVEIDPATGSIRDAADLGVSAVPSG